MRKKEIKPVWMPLYVDDYLSDTRLLSRAQHGSYVLLILEYWRRGRLPADEKKLARIALMTDAEWRSERDTLSEFFEPGWIHPRIDAELAKASEYISSRKNNALSGWSKRRAQGTIIPFPKGEE